MRCWHKELIPVLDRQHLISQFRECCCIAKSISEKGTPNHILVNRIMDYPLIHFIRYTWIVKCEMENRGYKCDWQKFIQYFPEKLQNSWAFMTVPFDEIFNGWHNNRYLNQCLSNLQEKYDCGGITEEEWNKIENMYIGYLLEGVNL